MDLVTPLIQDDLHLNILNLISSSKTLDAALGGSDEDVRVQKLKNG